MTYNAFLEESYRALRASAPLLAAGPAWDGWLKQIGELLVGLPPETQTYWVDQYATLLVVKYGGIVPAAAFGCVQRALAQARVAVGH